MGYLPTCLEGVVRPACSHGVRTRVATIVRETCAVTTTLTNADTEHTIAPASRPDGRGPSVGADTALVAVAAIGAAVIGAWTASRHGSALIAGIVVISAWVLATVAVSAFVRRSRVARLAGAIAGLNAIADGDLSRAARAGAGQE
ncbi:MAG: hypothetical protein QOK14_520, partial [Frankiaceae bacterium]|nr:hypothetical protein [Frankiaceae bacterium]